MYKTGKKKYDLFKTYYYDDAIKVGKHELPMLKPVKFIPDEVISFNEKSRLKPNDERWIDFFIDDALFECVWNNADRYKRIFKKAKGVITTDYSVYPELHPDHRSWNITRNRIIAYHLQEHMKLNIVPVASWCFENDFEWCFDGLPEESTIAVTSNGCSSSKYAMEIFIKGIEALYEHTKFSNLIVCGRPVKELEIEFKNVHYYPNFNERLSRRLKNGK